MSVYESIIQGLNEAIEYEKGTVKAKTAKLTVAPLPDIASGDVKSIRLSLNMTQVIFAEVIGVSVKTVEAWEAGTNTPSGIARRMLSLLQSDPSLPEKYKILSR
ncbi:MAG: helix-turn-helix domain-containing protein [Prevotella sp.]|nr:helix-turn-helix domain-containing protein [Alistipes senegalensis]MCM1358164.1 helix-turn-helix domain-containing protein [Prevotella sp.]MCM1474055.1 helix-turn-helix domain-containing protein [Muribaculaceae bacterium]MDE6425468.1 helix-turn-helix domain-containing protein [Ruminococcus sp.]